MSKFKTGDRVRFKNGRAIGTVIGDLEFENRVRVDWDNYPETAPESRLLILIEQESTVKETSRPFKKGDRVTHANRPGQEGTVEKTDGYYADVLWDGESYPVTHGQNFLDHVPAPVIEDEVAKTIAQLEERRTKKVESRKADQAQIEKYKTLIKNLEERIARTIVEQVSIADQIELFKTKNEH